MPAIILFIIQFLYVVTVVATGFHLCIHNKSYACNAAVT